MSTMEELEAAITGQGALVRKLKKGKAPVDEIKAAVAKLLQLKTELTEKFPPEAPFKKKEFDQLMIRRFFFGPSFELYGGVAGLFDFGPTGSTILNNVLTLWRTHFIDYEQMFEVNCTSLTPHDVLKASGHVDRFSDVMVKDLKTGDCLRADHLLEDEMKRLIASKDTSAEETKEYTIIQAKAETYTHQELDDMFKRFKVTAPATGNDLSFPMDFNMMFSTPIGPTGQLTGYLRPELAQGIFLNFKRLLEFNSGKLPFSGAQIGTAFRNEISPRNALIRVREFTLAEIEHFMDPEVDSHPGFADVENETLPFYSADAQIAGQPPTTMSLKAAKECGLINNESHGYFLGRITLFLKALGIDMERVRFRQHMPNEMAHYAIDCWDAEIKTSFGWVECVGCAHRGSYDLVCHAKATKTDLMAAVPLAEPISVEAVEIVADKGLVGRAFKKQAGLVNDHLAAMDAEAAAALQEKLAADGSATFNLEGNDFVFEAKMLKSVKKKTKKIHERKFVPAVVEPSFGVGRIIYAMLEHSFGIRADDEQKMWLKLSPLVAPVKCSLLPINNKPEMKPAVDRIAAALQSAGVRFRLDDSGASIGRRYARTDEIGIPFGVTVDKDSLTDDAATVRDCITTSQVRVKISEIAQLVADLAAAKITWDEVCTKYPKVERVPDEEKASK